MVGISKIVQSNIIDYIDITYASVFGFKDMRCFQKRACNHVCKGKYVDKHSFPSLSSVDDWPKLA